MRNKWFLIISLLIIAFDCRAAERNAIDFSLNNWDQKTVSLYGMKDRVIVLTFSYANCSVRCPIITGRLLSLDKAMNSPRDIAYVHISVDPDRDTPEKRRHYFSLYGIDAAGDDRWMFLSGRKNEVSRLWKFYGITSKKIKDRKLPEGYYIEYTPKVFVIDRNGLIVYEAGFDFSEEEMRSIIERLYARPSIRFSETTHDFGTVREGDVVSYEFEFTNEGRAPLIVKDLIPS
ncbi:MAG: hypothetical protein OHK0032_05650 [Thermodesulfovibrionales bacterium]